MPRYYCDYCDTYLTHDSPSVRKQHNSGYKHKGKLREYYQQFESQQSQIMIDQRIKEHLGQAAFQQGGAPYNPMMMMRPPFPNFPVPSMPMQGNYPAFVPGIRPPVLPRPPPVYNPIQGAHTMMAPPGPLMAPPPGSAPFPGHFNAVPGPPPPTMGGPTGMTGAPLMYNQQQPPSSAPLNMNNSQAP